MGNHSAVLQLSNVEAFTVYEQYILSGRIHLDRQSLRCHNWVRKETDADYLSAVALSPVEVTNVRIQYLSLLKRPSRRSSS